MCFGVIVPVVGVVSVAVAVGEVAVAGVFLFRLGPWQLLEYLEAFMVHGSSSILDTIFCIWRFPGMDVPPKWIVYDRTPPKIYDLGVPLFQKTSICLQYMGTSTAFHFEWCICRWVLFDLPILRKVYAD